MGTGSEPGGASGTAVWAHRGARAQAPENTLEAFALAIRLGADGVELDVHRSLDGGLVVHHDATAPDLGVLAELAAAEIRERRPDIPSLAEVLDCCAGSLVNIEIKNLPGDADYDPLEQTADAVVALLQARGRRDEVLVSSFNPAAVVRVRELDPGIPTALLTFHDDLFGSLEACVSAGHVALHPWWPFLNDDVLGGVVDRAHELGIALNVWTVNEAVELERFAGAGVDGVITDVPDVARRVLDERSG